MANDIMGIVYMDDSHKAALTEFLSKEQIPVNSFDDSEVLAVVREGSVTGILAWRNNSYHPYSRSLRIAAPCKPDVKMLVDELLTKYPAAYRTAVNRTDTRIRNVLENCGFVLRTDCLTPCVNADDCILAVPSNGTGTKKSFAELDRQEKKLLARVFYRHYMVNHYYNPLASDITADRFFEDACGDCDCRLSFIISDKSGIAAFCVIFRGEYDTEVGYIGGVNSEPIMSETAKYIYDIMQERGKLSFEIDDVNIFGMSVVKRLCIDDGILYRDALSIYTYGNIEK